MDKDTQNMGADAILSWHLFVDCPICDATFDLADIDAYDDYVYSHAIFNNRWGDLIGEEVECPKCQVPFKIESVDC